MSLIDSVQCDDCSPVSIWLTGLLPALDFELFPGSVGTAVCDAVTTDVPLHPFGPVWGALCPDLTPDP